MFRIRLTRAGFGSWQGPPVAVAVLLLTALGVGLAHPSQVRAVPSAKKPPTHTPRPTNTPGPTNTPTRTRTPTSTATATSPFTATPTPGGPPVPGSGIWISQAEILALPTSGAAWNDMKTNADANAGAPTVCDGTSNNNVLVLAKALVYARTGVEGYRTAVRQDVMGIIGTEDGATCESLALGRELAAYVISADLVGLSATEDVTFRAWLTGVRTYVLAGDSRSLVQCHEERANNWGTMCGASRAAASAYLGDRTDLDRAATVFKGYLGDRATYAGFSFGSDLSWHLDPNNPRGVNPLGAVKQGTNIDGVLPDDMRRGGSFTTGCPILTNYPWGALQGIVTQAELLFRQGYDAWNWENQAERRAVQYLFDLDARCGGWAADGDDLFIAWVINHVYGTSFPAVSPAGYGKVMAWTDWTHDRSTRPRQ